MRMFVSICSSISVGCILLTSCRAKNCNSLPEYFSSNGDAIRKIKSADFMDKDSVSNANGEWLMNANYFTCDGKKGYFIYRLRSGSESYNQDVPIGVWTEFKNSVSKETYYDQNIHKKYPGKTMHIIETPLP